jgi:glutathione synthetase
MGGLAERATNLHKRLFTKMGLKNVDVIPINEPIKTLCEAIYDAWKLIANQNAVILIVIGETNQNQFDQRQIEYELEKISEGKVLIIRLTLAECAERLILDEKTCDLLLDGKTVGIVYFRTGYLPEDYISENAWNARLLMERSLAIKCPWIGLQMANTKKIQQVLSCPDILERYLPSSSKDLENIRSTFAFMWGLEHDDDKTRAVIKDAIENPQNYVLKPQLEGGGGNYFDNEVSEKLLSFTPEMRASHILMQRIRPLVVKNCLIRPFDETSKNLQNVVSELGIYGSLIGIGGKEMLVKLNKAGGHILRTKSENVNEGGIAVGAAVVDTPLLF